MVATAIIGVGFVGTVTLVATSEQITVRAIAKQKMQLIADQMLEIIESDLPNIDNYSMNLTNCVDPGAGASQPLTRGYEWCNRMQNEVGAAGAGNTRSITITTLDDGRKVVHIILEAYGQQAQIFMKRVFED